MSLRATIAVVAAAIVCLAAVASRATEGLQSQSTSAQVGQPSIDYDH